jgi:hypothetical protein
LVRSLSNHGAAIYRFVLANGQPDSSDRLDVGPRN